jgi:hypothetical protein
MSSGYDSFGSIINVYSETFNPILTSLILIDNLIAHYQGIWSAVFFARASHKFWLDSFVIKRYVLDVLV